jgi:hypothetical protein
LSSHLPYSNIYENASTRIPPITVVDASNLQSMLVLANISAGNELDKEVVMIILVPHPADHMKSCL